MVQPAITSHGRNYNDIMTRNPQTTRAYDFARRSAADMSVDLDYSFVCVRAHLAKDGC